MSKIALTPNASGTGTFTLAAPNSNTSRTITLPDEAGEVLVNGTTQNVGIGTSSPSSTLAVETGSTASLSSYAGHIVVGPSSRTSSSGDYSGGILFDQANGVQASGKKGASITGFQDGSDVNSMGITFNVHGVDGSANRFEAMRIDSSGNVGIGTGSPVGLLDLEGSGNSNINFSTTNDYGGANINILGGSLGSSGAGIGYSPHLRFGTVTGKSSGFSEVARFDISGKLLVGQSSTTQPGVGNTTTGIAVRNDGLFFANSSASRTGTFGRNNSGPVMGIYGNGSFAGHLGVSIGTYNYPFFSGSGTGIRSDAGFDSWTPCDDNGATKDNALDWGTPSGRWDDIYATNGTIQTSDRNEKQDIEVLSDAETRVAQACKGLLRKFRWQDAVAEKGDDARIHFGIIAQDLQDAFAAEGLDAGRYAMFISSTWWETQTEVPAVEAVDAVYEDVVIPAVLDEEGNELEAERTEQQLVTEAVEAKDAYTRTDTYETQAEAPEGATERTRLGVRYPELLAFIIGAM